MMKSTESTPPDLPKFSTRTVATIAGAMVLAMAGLFILGFWPRHKRIEERESMARAVRDRPMVVQAVQPESTTRPIELALPADIRAYASTALYARTNGYLASWTVDINDRVKKGDVLAVISAPDTDAELEQAVAALNQQQTNHRLAVATEERYRGLIAIRGVTQQQLDQFYSTREQAAAGVSSAAAAVDRLKALVGFEKIIAPFDGVVTARTYDVGALISASNIGPGQELFQLAEDDRLRVFVNVPQAYALLLKFGQSVGLVLERNYPGYKFVGTVARSTGSLDPSTRTLRTELDFKNDDPNHRLYPGMYGEAVFSLQREQPVLTVPTSALLFEAEGKEVAVVGPDNKVHLQKIVPGSDFGTEIEVISGLTGQERIVANPGEQIVEGLVVTPAAPGKNPPFPAKKSP